MGGALKCAFENGMTIVYSRHAPAPAYNDGGIDLHYVDIGVLKSVHE